MLVHDFSAAKSMVVKRSAHYCKQHGGRDKGQLGLVVDKKLFQENGALVCYPVVFWEGAVMSTVVHPANVTPFRLAERRALPKVEVSP